MVLPTRGETSALYILPSRCLETAVSALYLHLNLSGPATAPISGSASLPQQGCCRPALGD